MVALTIVVPFNMLMISLEPCIYGFHFFVNSTWLTKVIFNLLGNTHFLFIYTALQIWHGFKLLVGVACSKKNSFVNYSKTHSIVNYSNSHLCAAPNHKFTLSQQIEKEGKARKKEEWFMCEWLMLIDMVVCLWLICIDLNV